MTKKTLSAVVLALGGGKGGTGKSLLAVQIGILLAHSGLRTILVDADPNGANVHTFFGLEDPERALDDVLVDACAPQEAVWPSGVPRLDLLPGMREGLTASLNTDRRTALFQQLRKLPADVVIWDVGSGMRPWSTHLFSQADVGLLITMPEAIAVERDYRFLRRVCRWKVADALPPGQQPPADWLPVPWLVRLQRDNLALAEMLKERLQQQKLLWVLNGSRSPEDRTLGEELGSVCRRFLGIQGEALGWLAYDERIWLSIRQRRPMVLEFPESQWTMQVHQLVADLLPFLLQTKQASTL